MAVLFQRRGGEKSSVDPYATDDQQQSSGGNRGPSDDRVHAVDAIHNLLVFSFQGSLALIEIDLIFLVVPEDDPVNNEAQQSACDDAPNY